MSHSLRKLNLGLSILTGGVALIALLGWAPGDLTQWVLFGLIMLLTGIPHGAVDHLVFFRAQKETHWAAFLGRYLGLMGLYGLLWFLAPGLSLGLFFLLTCYHFGQSEWHFLRWEEHRVIKVVLYLGWGMWLLLAFFLFQTEASLIIMDGLVDAVFWREMLTRFGPISLFGLTFLWASLLVYAAFWRVITDRELFHSLLMSALLLAMIAWAPLLVSFAVYFGGWHALKAIQAEKTVLFAGESRSLWRWIKAAIPFSLLSLLGIGALVWLAASGYTGLHPVMVFFIAISVLTLPHMVLMQKVYLKGK